MAASSKLLLPSLSHTHTTMTADDDEGTTVSLRGILQLVFPRLVLSETSIHWLATRIADRYKKPYSAGCDLTRRRYSTSRIFFGEMGRGLNDDIQELRRRARRG